MDAFKLLETSTLFATLDRSLLWQIASLTQEMFFSTNDYLIHEGDEADFCYIINDGLVQVFRDLSLSKKVIIAELGQGEILGELSLIDRLPRSSSVIALKPTHTFAISAWDFKAQLQAYPEIALQLLPILAKRLRGVEEQLIKSSS